MSAVLQSYDVALAVRDQGRDAFIAAHPHLFFLQLAEGETTQAVERSFKTANALPAAAMQLARDGYQMTVDLARVTLYVIAKAANNPWKERIIVGRARNNDVSIDHGSISKVHAYVTQSGNEYTIVDAGSRNGTWVNGRPVSTTDREKLRVGAQVRLGSVVLELIDAASVYDRFKDAIQKRP